MSSLYNNSFWVYNNKQYKNKIHALNDAQGKLNDIDFFIAKHSFDAVNWKIEPKKSWYDMMAIRARQLRDTYDYIRFWYSGGVDSQTIFNVFLKERIYIDEIIVNLVSPIDDFSGPANIEQLSVAIPFLKSVESVIPKTKITINKLGSQHFKKIFDNDWLDQQVDLSMIQDQPWSLYKTKMLEPKNNFCDLTGGEKPEILKKASKYYAVFVDEAFLPRITGTYTEEFYISPEYPQLHIKQCHRIENHLQKNYPDLHDGFVYGNGTKKKNGIDLAVEAGVRDNLYKPYDVGKGSIVYGPKQQFLIHQSKHSETDLHGRHKESLQTLQKIHKDNLNNGKIENGFIGIINQRYEL